MNLDRNMALLQRFAADDTGATAIEYGLLVSIFGLVLVTAMANVVAGTNGVWNSITNALIAALK